LVREGRGREYPQSEATDKQQTNHEHHHQRGVINTQKD